MLEKLQSIDFNILTNVVQKDTGDPNFEIIDWKVSKISHQGVINPDGLLLFSGQGQSGNFARPWSVVVKVLHDPNWDVDQTHVAYWKREFEAYESGLLTRLPGTVVAPRYYGSTQIDDDIVLWMEHIIGTASSSWSREDYIFAARQLGLFNGAYTNGTPLPDYAWLSTGQTRNWFPAPITEMEKAWENPIVRETFSENLHDRCRRLWAERARLYDVLDCLPQVFSHFDFQHRNLFIRKRKDNSREIVAVDWSECGIGPIGGDLTHVVATNLMLLDMDIDEVNALENHAFNNYLRGLEEAGWKGNPDIVRLGYTAWTGLWWGATMPLLTNLWTSEIWFPIDQVNTSALRVYGKMGKELAAEWANLCTFAIDRADEALRLADRLM